MGNIRVSYFKNTNGSAEVLEENNFYPFGMKHEGYNQTQEILLTITNTAEKSCRRKQAGAILEQECT
ncbi:hypothetical protein [Chryseobacterium sp.]|uniref:hypothetical protein n=1 Tax=Chryseobacterium sp. TaxID=1871047 RepID=UPI0035C6E4C7